MRSLSWPRLAFVAAFFALSLVKVAHHEIWTDESELWDAARESGSLAELHGHTLYIGQPLTTHLPFYAASRFTRDPFAMQVMNVVEITAVVAVVVFAAPWPFLYSMLFAIGYFPFFEYGTISRHYALLLLFGVAFCALYRRAGGLGPWAACAAGLLALASFYGTIFALGLLLALAATWLLERRAPGRVESVGILVIVACIAFSIRTAVPPSDSVILKSWQQALRPGAVVDSVATLWTGYAPLPPLRPPWWNRNLLGPWPMARLALGLLLLGVGLWSVRRSALAVGWLAFSTLGLVAFDYLQWGGFARHAGLLYVALVLALWLAAVRGRVLLLFFALQIPGGLFMSYKDLVEPFSPSVQTADYLRRNGLDGLPIVGHKEVVVSVVSTLLDRPFFSPTSRGWIRWPELGSRMRRTTLGDVRMAATRLGEETRSDVILVINSPLPPDTGPLPTGRALHVLASFHEDFLGQTFWIYRLDRVPQARSNTSTSEGSTPSNAN